MSRKTKAKSREYYELNTGQVVRLDTMETDKPVQRKVTKARRYAHPIWRPAPVDTDHTRSHREEKKREAVQAQAPAPAQGDADLPDHP